MLVFILSHFPFQIGNLIVKLVSLHLPSIDQIYSWYLIDILEPFWFVLPEMLPVQCLRGKVRLVFEFVIVLLSGRVTRLWRKTTAAGCSTHPHPPTHTHRQKIKKLYHTSSINIIPSFSAYWHIIIWEILFKIIVCTRITSTLISFKASFALNAKHTPSDHIEKRKNRKEIPREK